MKKINQSIILLFVLLSSCSGKDVSFREDEIIECNYTKQIIQWDEVSPSGIVPEDILAFSEFQIEEVNAKSISSINQEKIYLKVIRRENNALYMASETCESFLEIPLLVSLRTKNETTFDETFKVLARELNGGLAIDHTFKLNDLSGDFHPPTPQGSKIHSLSLVMVITSTGVKGKILVHIEEKHTDGSLTETIEEHWSW